MLIVAAQLDPVVGDIAANTEAVAAAVLAAKRAGASLVITSEMALLGYPPRDLVLRAGVAESCVVAAERLASAYPDLTLLVGLARPLDGESRPCANSVALCRGGRVERFYDKRLLPTYDIFDEERYFAPGGTPLLFTHQGVRVGVLVCEDLWRAVDARSARRYRDDPAAETVAAGAHVLLVASASPFVIGKHASQRELVSDASARLGVPIVVCNQVGGNDDLVFDGGTMLAVPDAGVVRELPRFRESIEVIEVPVPGVIGVGAGAGVASAAGVAGVAGLAGAEGIESGAGGAAAVHSGSPRPPRAGVRGSAGAGGSSPEAPMAEVYAALVLGLRDYLAKTRHREVVIGLSGGVDSALVAVLAVAAIGPANVHGLLMPGSFSSSGSLTDAIELAQRLKLASRDVLGITEPHALLRARFARMLGRFEGIADENLQSRLRGLTLMAFSNATGALVVTTGNKSEFATGYATLYGDMSGGIAPIGDLLKTQVYDVARYVNAEWQRLGFALPPIPEPTLTKPPSAELRPDQTDQDTLPPYERLDRLIDLVVHEELDAPSIARRTGEDPAFVQRWCEIIDREQYKRDQAPVILKVNARSFGRGRPMPIAARSRPVPRADP